MNAERLEALNVVLPLYRRNLAEVEAEIERNRGVLMDCNYVLGYMDIAGKPAAIGLFVRYNDAGKIAIGGIVGAARMNKKEAEALAPYIEDGNGENPVPVKYMPALLAYRDEMANAIPEFEAMLAEVA